MSGIIGPIEVGRRSGDLWNALWCLILLLCADFILLLLLLFLLNELTLFLPFGYLHVPEFLQNLDDLWLDASHAVVDCLAVEHSRFFCPPQ